VWWGEAAQGERKTLRDSPPRIFIPLWCRKAAWASSLKNGLWSAALLAAAGRIHVQISVCTRFAPTGRFAARLSLQVEEAASRAALSSTCACAFQAFVARYRGDPCIDTDTDSALLQALALSVYVSARVIAQGWHRPGRALPLHFIPLWCRSTLRSVAMLRHPASSGRYQRS